MASRVVVSVVCAAALLASSGGAWAGLIGTGLTVTFDSPGDGVGPTSDAVTATLVAPEPELAFGDGSNIDNDFIFYDNEWIDIDNDFIELQLEGLSPHPNPLYNTTGWSTGAKYVFSGLGDNVVGISVELTDVIGVSVGSEAVLDSPTQITLFVDTLGILERANAPDIGRVKINLEFQGTGPGPDVIPEPATLALLGLGIAALAARRRRRS